jgi:hypothetical protein
MYTYGGGVKKHRNPFDFSGFEATFQTPDYQTLKK